MPTPRETIVATVGAEVLTSITAASSRTPDEPTPRPRSATTIGQAGGDDGAEGQHEQQQRDDDADDLTGAARRQARAVGHLAAEGHLQAGVDGRLGGLLQRGRGRRRCPRR